MGSVTDTVQRPGPIDSFVRDQLVARFQTTYIKVDPQGIVVDSGGDLAIFGLENIEAGQPVAEAAYYLDGMLPVSDPVSIPAMMTDSGRYADVHLFSEDGHDWVVLLDVTDEIQQKQIIQQKGNELSLVARQLEIRNEFIKNTFGRYLSDEIVEEILESPEGLNLSGETRKVTILMNDLRGFTSMCERLEPDQVVKMLNNFLGTMTEVILKYGGTIDEFIGDAILVIFGAPVPRDDDAARAVACAVEMLAAMDKVNQYNRDHDLPEVEMGIGLNTGTVIVGNIGSERRLKYGVVGSNVNLTARIESYTVGGQLLVSEQTLHDAGGHVEVNGSMEVSPKGVTEPITIFDVVGIGGKFNVRLDRQEEQILPVPEVVPVRFTILEGKHAGDDAFIGQFVQLSNQGAGLRSDRELEVLSNLKFQILDSEGREISGDLYGKIRESDRVAENDYYVRFTSIPPVLDEYLKSLVTAAYRARDNKSG